MGIPSAPAEDPDVEKKISEEGNYFPVSPDTLNPDVLTDFRVYLQRGKHYVLFTKERQHFSEALKKRLLDNGIQTVYVPYHQQALYETYVFENLEWILNDATISMDVKSQVFLDTTNKELHHVSS